MPRWINPITIATLATLILALIGLTCTPEPDPRNHQEEPTTTSDAPTTTAL